jgi:hypothetical protein
LSRDSHLDCRAARQIGVGSGQAGVKIGHRRALAFQQAGFDVDIQNIPRPAVRNGALGVG